MQNMFPHYSHSHTLNSLLSHMKHISFINFLTLEDKHILHITEYGFHRYIHKIHPRIAFILHSLNTKSQNNSNNLLEDIAHNTHHSSSYILFRMCISHQ